MSSEGPVAVIAPDASWHCHTLPESQIDALERDSALGSLYRLWRNVRGDGIPTEDQFNPLAVLGDANTEGFLRICTESSNPLDYTVAVAAPDGRMAEAVAIGSLDNSIQHRELTIDLLYCRQRRAPVFQEIRHVVSLAEYRYRRLLLPVENALGVVSGIFLCFRMLSDDAEAPHEEAPPSSCDSVSLAYRDHAASGADRDVTAHERRQLPVWHLLDREFGHGARRDTALATLFKYWHDRHEQGRLPLGEIFDPSGVFTPEEMRWVSWIDVAPDNPFDFVLHNHPGLLFGDLSNTALRDFPYRSQGICCAFEYDQCKRIREPAYHEVKQCIAGYYRSYARLLLPTVDQAGNVTRLYYASRYLTPPTAV